MLQCVAVCCMLFQPTLVPEDLNTHTYSHTLKHTHTHRARPGLDTTRKEPYFRDRALPGGEGGVGEGGASFVSRGGGGIDHTRFKSMYRTTVKKRKKRGGARYPLY